VYNFHLLIDESPQLQSSIAESIWSDVARQNPGSMSLPVQKEIAHYNEMNEQILTIDIDMNM
jgi:hypothetical protein